MTDIKHLSIAKEKIEQAEKEHKNNNLEKAKILAQTATANALISKGKKLREK
jgi:hypothetical protein